MAKKLKFTTKADVMPPVKEQDWNPAPDMGAIKPPPPETKKCLNSECTHEGSTHYGGPSNWCNVGGCNCQMFTQK